MGLFDFLGGGGGETVQKTKIPDYLANAAKGTLGFAQQYANQPYTPYGGQTVAGITPNQQQAYDWTAGNLGRTQGQMEGFLPGISALQGFDPGQVHSSSFAGTNMAPYMNPYTQNVVDTSMAALERGRQGAIQQGQGAAQAAGAYGGSRHGVADSLTNEAFARQAAETSAGLYGQGYQQAAALRMGDIENQLRARLANQQAGIQGAGVQLEAGRLGGALAQQAGQAGMQSAEALRAAGNAQQAQTQAQLDDRYKRFLAQRDYPQQQLNIMLSALGGVPYGQTVTQSGGGAGPLGSILGGGLQGAAAGNTLAPGGWGAGIGGILGLLSGTGA